MRRGNAVCILDRMYQRQAYHDLRQGVINLSEPVTDLGGPLRPKIFSISCSFSQNLAKSYVGAPLKGWRPLLRGILDPPLRTFFSLLLRLTLYVSYLSCHINCFCLK